MTAYSNLNTQPPAYALVAVLCQACAVKVGTVYADDHVTLLCGRCAVIAYGAVPNDEVSDG